MGIRALIGGWLNSNKKSSGKDHEKNKPQNSLNKKDINGVTVLMYRHPDLGFNFESTRTIPMDDPHRLNSNDTNQLMRHLYDIKRTVIDDQTPISVPDSRGELWDVYEAKLIDGLVGKQIRMDYCPIVYFTVPSGTNIESETLLLKVADVAYDVTQATHGRKNVGIGQFIPRGNALDAWSYIGQDEGMKQFITDSIVIPRNEAYKRKIVADNIASKARQEKEFAENERRHQQKQAANVKLYQDLSIVNKGDPTFQSVNYRIGSDAFFNRYKGININNGYEFELDVCPLSCPSAANPDFSSNVYPSDGTLNEVVYDCMICTKSKYDSGATPHRIFFAVPEVDGGRETLQTQFITRQGNRDVLPLFQRKKGENNPLCQVLLELLSQSRIYKNNFSGFVGRIVYDPKDGFSVDYSSRPYSDDAAKRIDEILSQENDKKGLDFMEN